MSTTPTRPLLSIVIPTKNRYETLFATLDALLTNIKDNRIELVVQDNSDDPSLAKAYFENFNDSRIKYSYLEGSISILENTEAALERAGGEYVTFIGDDDFVDADIISFVEDFSKRRIKAVIYPSAFYWWKSVEFAVTTRFHRPGAFWYPRHLSNNEQTINTKNELGRALSHGAVGMYDLPRVYHGIVHRSVLDSIKEKTCHFMNGASPDMALAIAVSLVIDEHTKVSTPLTIYGASKDSGGGWTASRRHFGRISEQAHLPKSTKDNWNKKLPPVWSEYTIYAQTAGEVLAAFGDARSLNYLAFYASMIVNEPHLRKYATPFVIQAVGKDPLSLFAFLVSLFRRIIGRLMRAIKSRLFGLPFELFFYDSPNDCMKHISRARLHNIL